MTIVTDPYSVLAGALEQVILNEFEDDSPKITVVHDRIHESLGYNGRGYVGISPVRENSERITTNITALVQFYDAYSLEIDPEQHVDPRNISNKAERFRRAVQKARIIADELVWYMDVTYIEYPNDATGNKSRFEATVITQGENTGLIETSL